MLYFECFLICMGLVWSHVFLNRLLRDKSLSPFLSSLFFPMRVLLFVLFFTFLLQVLGLNSCLEMRYVSMEVVRKTSLVICFVWMFSRFRATYFETLVNKICDKNTHCNKGTLGVLANVLSSLVYFSSFFALLQMTGVNILPFLTFGGIGVAAIGFASKDVMVNLFAGFILQATSPFKVGDFIDVPDKKIAGKVECIGWYTTTLKDEKKRPIYVPNGLFSTTSIINLSRVSHRLISEVIEIPSSSEDVIESVIGKIFDLLKNQGNVDESQLHVHLHSIGLESSKVEIRALCTVVKYDEFILVKQRLLLAIRRVITDLIRT